jgi:hypothetical protein
MRGREGPVRSRSRSPTRVVGEVLSRDSASWTVEELLPTPPAKRVQPVVSGHSCHFKVDIPFPEMTMMMFLTLAKRRETGVSILAML